MSFPRYPTYKASGVKWLGNVPVHWEVVKLKHVARSIEQGWSPQCQSFPVDTETEWGVLKVGCVNGGKFDPSENKALPPDLDPDPLLTLIAGDLLLSRANTRELVGSAAVVERSHPNLMLCDKLYRLRFEADCSPRFVCRYLESSSAREQIKLEATGASDSMLNIGQWTILNLQIAAPGLHEQEQIAIFLDRETTKIDALVTEQRHLIELLKEKRQAVISLAVTKGLNPHAPMKDSGIEWLGRVPAHWTISPLKWLTDPSRPIMYGIVLPGPDVGRGVPILKGGNVKPSRMNLQSMARTTPEIEAPYARARLRAGDLVYSIRGSIGDCERVPAELEGSNITQDVARVAADRGVCASWLRWALLASAIREELASQSLGATIRGVNIFDLKRANIPTPPEDEQVAIADFLESETSRLDALEAEAQRAIAVLQERRTALISAAVTGQIDVRQLAAKQVAA